MEENRRGFPGAREGEKRSLGHDCVEMWKTPGTPCAMTACKSAQPPEPPAHLAPSLHVGQRIKLAHPVPHYPHLLHVMYDSEAINYPNSSEGKRKKEQ